jgi:hypothetical protein
VDKPYYELDVETHTWLERVFAWASLIADGQLNQNDTDDMYELLAELAERFGMDTDPYANELPSPKETVVQFERQPTLRVVVDRDSPVDEDSFSTTD